MGCDFSYAYLYAANFSGVKEQAMQGVKFTGACLVNAKFDGVNFHKGGDDQACSLQGACLRGATFKNATLEGTEMRNAAIAKERGKMEITVNQAGKLVTTTVSYKPTEVEAASATTNATKCPSGKDRPPSSLPVDEHLVA